MIKKCTHQYDAYIYNKQIINNAAINVQSIQYEIQNTIHTYNKEQYYTLPIYKYTTYKELHLKQ